VEEVGELACEFCADFGALEGAAGSEDCYFGHCCCEIDFAGVAFEVAGCFDVLFYFFFN
jgi:hypothetical protein